jgi:ketosteroid isomerase-like protein
MPSQPHAAADLAALGRQWIAAWNSRDLERVLALYAEDSEMTSDRIPALGFDASGTLRGKDGLRAYWGAALQRLPNLHFDLIDTYVSPDSIVVLYRNERGARICEYLRLDAEGKIRQGSANHLIHWTERGVCLSRLRGGRIASEDAMRVGDSSQRDNWREKAIASCLFTFSYFRSRSRRRFLLRFAPIVIDSGTDEIF